MSDYKIQASTLKGIADSIRAKTGGTDEIVVADMASAIEGITGGGSAEGFVTVTFMNGDTVVYSRPVYIGDNCPDPVTQGRIDAPTKESTVDTVFTHNGWASADGGAASSSVLKNIQADTVVYSAFAESERLYTIRFYDGETLLYTEQLPYGGSSNYTYKKDNYLFNGWNPEPKNITTDLDCYGEWEESYAFADASWDYISRIVEEGKASEVWSLKDTKDIVLTYADGTTETVTFIIAGFNHDNLADGSGKASISLVATQALNEKRQMNPSKNNITWENSSLRAWCNGDLFNALPSKVREIVKEVNKVSCATTVVDSEVISELITTADKCWLLTPHEWDKSFNFPSLTLNGQGEPYVYQLTSEITSNILTSDILYTTGGEQAFVWTRSSYVSGTNFFLYRTPTSNNFGEVTQGRNVVTFYHNVLFGFCI